MKLSIATPDRVVASKVAIQNITVPGGEGEMTILSGHASYIGTIGIGVFSFDQENGTKLAGSIAHGFIQIHNDEVIVLADRIELSTEIDVERARKAQVKAEEALKAKAHFDEDHAKWIAKLERAKMRQLAAHYLPH